MKKLMFIAAVMTAGMCLSDIVSANVVGYQEIPVAKGYSMRAATFKAITGDYKISDIKVVGVVGEGDDTAQVISEDGTWNPVMYWYLNGETAETGVAGWYTDMFGSEPVTDADMLAIGQALYIQTNDATEEDIKLTVSGEVASGEVSVPVGNYAMVGNPTPVEVKIGTIAVVGAVGEGDDSIQKLASDGSGTWEPVMYWYLNGDAAETGVAGWYTDMFGSEPVTDADKLSPGEGVYVQAIQPMTMKFASPIAE